MQDAVVVVDHLLCSQAPQAQASLVVRVFRIALDVVDDAVLHVHQQSAVLMASWAGACVGPDDGHAVFFPGPFPTGRVVLGRRVLGFFLDEEGAVDVGFDLVFDFGLRFCHDGCPLSFLSMSARADEACRVVPDGSASRVRAPDGGPLSVADAVTCRRVSGGWASVRNRRRLPAEARKPGGVVRLRHGLAAIGSQPQCRARGFRFRRRKRHGSFQLPL